MRREPLFRTCRPEIAAYCESHGLSYEKLKKCGILGLDEKNLFQYWDPNSEKAMRGLMDETPAPVVLIVEKTKHGLRFTETDHTKTYLMKD